MSKINWPFEVPVFVGQKLLILGLFSIVCTTTSWAQDASTCGSLENNYGPIDYRKMTPAQSRLVEGAHFTPGVENLTQPKSSFFADDISYTLNVFPNHHRALLTMQRLADREKKDKPAYAKWSMACYYERAVRYQPDDHIVRMLFASYLIKNKRVDDATQQLNVAIELGVESSFTQFNAGLVFLDMNNYERALAQAHKAIGMGFPRTDIKDRLVALGKWKDPVTPIESPKP
jgi:tetratricopeptide (TPR) repeat protein